MTITEIVEEGMKDFAVVSCADCLRFDRPIFRIRINNPQDKDLDHLRFKALRHDRSGTHPVLLLISRKAK